MASGDTLLILTPHSNAPPATLFATLDEIVGASTPAENIPVLDFDDTTQEYADFLCVMPEHYGGGGLTIDFMWSAAEAASDVCEWQIALRRIADDAEDLDTTAHTYAYNAVVATAAGTIGEVAYDTITFTDGVDMDSVAAGDYFLLRITRDPSPSSGTDVTGDASLHAIHVKET